MNNKKKSFLLYLDTLEILHKLTDEQAGRLLKSFLAYHSGQDFNLDPMLDLVFFSFQAQFERDGTKYNTIVERNRNNGSKGGRPKNPVKAKKPSGLSGNPSEPRKADSDKDSDKDSDSDNKVIKNSRFTPPSLNEVQQYCNERMNFVDPQNFIDHYASNGWVRGKTKIKDWKACVRTWEKNAKPKNKVKQHSDVTEQNINTIGDWLNEN